MVDVKVYYFVHKTACDLCKKTYLYPNGRPKIFKLLKVIQNGDNIGRKKDETVASTSPIHPRCRCSIKYVKTKINAKAD